MRLAIGLRAHEGAAVMVYPGRPRLKVLPEFEGTATPRGQTPEQRARLLNFVAAGYADGRSLRELAELTGRSQAAIRRALDQAGVERRGRGAPRIWDDPRQK